MFYYLTRYSFDMSKPVTGPFASKEMAWAAMKADAENEYDIAVHENEWAATLSKDFDSNEIVLSESFENSEADTITWLLFEIR